MFQAAEPFDPVGHAMTTAQSAVKRLAVWMAAAGLAFVLYLAGAPIVISIVFHRIPAATPVLFVVYAPLDYHVRSSLPGSQMYVEYVQWNQDWYDSHFK